MGNTTIARVLMGVLQKANYDFLGAQRTGSSYFIGF